MADSTHGVTHMSHDKSRSSQLAGGGPGGGGQLATWVYNNNKKLSTWEKAIEKEAGMNSQKSVDSDFIRYMYWDTDSR